MLTIMDDVTKAVYCLCIIC